LRKGFAEPSVWGEDWLGEGRKNGTTVTVEEEIRVLGKTIGEGVIGKIPYRPESGGRRFG